MSRLILIRHSIPQPDASVPPNQWRLSHAGRERCRLLAESLKPHSLSFLVSSVEPKAIETARLTADHLGIPSQIAQGLQEQERGSMGYLPDEERFEKHIREVFAKPDEKVFGDETAMQAGDRFATAIEHLLEAHPNERLGVVTHGTVMSLFVAQANGLDGFELWKQMSLPGFVVLRLSEMAIIELVKVAADES